MGKIHSDARYTFSSWDGDLDKVASRFRTTSTRIYECSRGLDEKYQVMTETDFRISLKDGNQLKVPLQLEERSWQWNMYSPTPGDTLQQICNILNKDKQRSGMPVLTPQYVFLHVMNSHFRYIQLDRRWIDSEKVDADPSGEKAKPAQTLFIPYPIWDDQGHIDLTPAPKSTYQPHAEPKTPVATRPAWVGLLEHWVSDIDDKAKRLRDLEYECQLFRKNAATYVTRLTSLLALFDVMKKHSPDSNVSAVRAKLSDFYDLAYDRMTLNPSFVAELQADKDRLTVAKDLLSTLRDPKFKELFDHAIQTPCFEDDQRSMLVTACSCMEAAYAALSDGYLANEHHKDLEGMYEVIGKAKDGVPPPQATTAFLSAMSLVGTDQENGLFMLPAQEAEAGIGHAGAKALAQTAALTAPVIVGNLAGPSSLVVSMSKVLAHRYCIVEFNVEGKSIPNFRKLFNEVLAKALRFNDNEKALINDVLKMQEDLAGRTAGLEGTELGAMLSTAASKELQGKIKTNIDEIEKSISGRYFRGVYSRGGFMGLCVFGMYFSWKGVWNVRGPEHSNWELFASICNALGSTVSGVASTADFIAYWASDEFKKKLLTFVPNGAEGVGAMLGFVGGLVVAIAGVCTAVDAFSKPKTDVAEAAAGISETIGGVALMVAALGMVCPPLAPVVVAAEVIGALALAVSTVASNWTELTQKRIAGTEKLARYHLDAFKKSREYIAISAKVGELGSAWDEVEKAFEASKFDDFEGHLQEKIGEALSARFGKDIDFMFKAYWSIPDDSATSVAGSVAL